MISYYYDNIIEEPNLNKIEQDINDSNMTNKSYVDGSWNEESSQLVLNFESELSQEDKNTLDNIVSNSIEGEIISTYVVDTVSYLFVKGYVNSKEEVLTNLYYIIKNPSDDDLADKEDYIIRKSDDHYITIKPKEGILIFVEEDKKLYIYLNDKWEEFTINSYQSYLVYEECPYIYSSRSRFRFIEVCRITVPVDGDYLFSWYGEFSHTKNNKFIKFLIKKTSNEEIITEFYKKYIVRPEWDNFCGFKKQYFNKDEELVFYFANGFYKGIAKVKNVRLLLRRV